MKTGSRSKIDGEADAAPSYNPLSKAFSLLTKLAEVDRPMALGELAETCELPKATAHRLLEALREFSVVAADGGVYRLGPGCLTLGICYLGQLDIRREARPFLEELMAFAEETVHLAVLDGTRAVRIDCVEAKNPIRMHSAVGAGAPLHSSASGKVLLAYSPPDVVARVVEAGLERRTHNTITDPDELRFALSRVRQSGFALDDDENELGVRCVGAPIFNHDGVIAAVVSVSGPSYRIGRDRLLDLAPVVMNTAKQISARLGGTSPRTGTRSPDANHRNSGPSADANSREPPTA